jgi:DNA-binding MarR family transcriptional regulator
VHTPTPEILQAWSALLIAHRRLTTLLDDQLRREAGISLDEYDVLYQIRSAGTPLHMSQLAQRLVISRPTASRVIDRLVARGWVERWHDEGDRRVVLLALSAAGRQAQTRAGRIHVKGINHLFGEPLAGYDIAALTAALRAVAPPS